MKNNSKATKTEICKAIPRRCLGTFSSGLNPAFGEAHAQLSPSGQEWKQVAGGAQVRGQLPPAAAPIPGPLAPLSSRNPHLTPLPQSLSLQGDPTGSGLI